MGHGQPVVPHSGLAGEEPSMNARQHNGALSTRDTDNPMLIGDELTGPHQRGDVTALGAGQVKVPNAHCPVAATNNGEQVCAQGAHGAHCRPPAEWAQPAPRHPVDNRRIGQPVASGAHRSVTDVLRLDCHPCPETQHPSSQGMVSKSDTKESNHFSPSPTNRGITRFCQARSVLDAAFVSDLDTPTAPGPARLEPHGRPLAGVIVARAHPDQDGTPHPAAPSSRGDALFCRAGPTSTDQVTGSCGRSCSDSLGP